MVGFWCGVWGSGFQISGFGFRVSGFGFRGSVRRVWGAPKWCRPAREREREGAIERVRRRDGGSEEETGSCFTSKEGQGMHRDGAVLPGREVHAPTVCLLLVGLGFRVSGVGFRIADFELRVSDFGFRVSGFGLEVLGWGLESRVQSLGPTVRLLLERFGLDIQISGFRV